MSTTSTAVPSGASAKAADVAKAFRVSVRTVQRMADDGEIPHYRVRGQLRFDLDEVRSAFRVERSA